MTAMAAPLDGQKVLLLRPTGQQDTLLAALQHLGAEALHLPVIEIFPTGDWSKLDYALRQLHDYDWLLFTSANAVKIVTARADEIGVALPQCDDSHPRVCVVGPATREAAELAGLPIHRMPQGFVAEGIVEAFGSENLSGKRLLLPRAAVAREVVPDSLRAQGMHVDTIAVYCNQIPAEAASEVAALLQRSWQPDWILFTSASTVKNLLAVGGRPLLLNAKLASIGPATSDAIKMHGFPVYLESAEHSANGLVDAMLRARV
jgi:uroporphyrinogen III methyltransferase / synthase